MENIHHLILYQHRHIDHLTLTMDTNSLFNVKVRRSDSSLFRLLTLTHQGKTVLITGGAKGIGRMMAEGFLTNGAKVYLAGRSSTPMSIVRECSLWTSIHKDANRDSGNRFADREKMSGSKFERLDQSHVFQGSSKVSNVYFPSLHG